MSRKTYHSPDRLRKSLKIRICKTPLLSGLRQTRFASNGRKRKPLSSPRTIGFVGKHGGCQSTFTSIVSILVTSLNGIKEPPGGSESFSIQLSTLSYIAKRSLLRQNQLKKRLKSLIHEFGIPSASSRTVQIAVVQSTLLYGTKRWCN